MTLNQNEPLDKIKVAVLSSASKMVLENPRFQQWVAIG